MNKGLKITLIVLLSILAASIITFLVLVLTNKIKFKDLRFNGKVSTELVLDNEYDNTFKKIIISSDAADIDIKESTSEKIKVIIYGDKERTEVNDSSEELNIMTTTKPCRLFCIGTTISKIEVYLPTTFAGDINVKDKFGDIKVDTVSNIEANTNYGDIKISNVNNYFDLETNYGDIKIDTVNISKDSKAVTDFGDIKIGSTNRVYIEAKTDLGDVKVNNNYRESEIELILKTDLGDIKINN